MSEGDGDRRAYEVALEDGEVLRLDNAWSLLERIGDGAVQPLEGSGDPIRPGAWFRAVGALERGSETVEELSLSGYLVGAWTASSGVRDFAFVDNADLAGRWDPSMAGIKVARTRSVGDEPGVGWRRRFHRAKPPAGSLEEARWRVDAVVDPMQAFQETRERLRAGTLSMEGALQRICDVVRVLDDRLKARPEPPAVELRVFEPGSSSPRHVVAAVSNREVTQLVMHLCALGADSVDVLDSRGRVTWSQLGQGAPRARVAIRAEGDAHWLVLVDEEGEERRFCDVVGESPNQRALLARALVARLRGREDVRQLALYLSLDQPTRVPLDT